MLAGYVTPYPWALIDDERTPDQRQRVRTLLVIAIGRDIWYRSLNVMSAMHKTAKNR